MSTGAPPSDGQWQQALHRVLREPAASITLHRQPIIDLRRGVTAGFELLARFADPQIDAPPHHWFGAAYRLGVGPQLEAAVVQQALRLRLEAPPNTFLTVNLDPAALRHEPVAGLLLAEESLGGFVVELTEHTEIDDLEWMNGLLAELRRRGALIAVDDAGTGYAGLKRLLAVRPEFVKVDQAFIRGIAEDPAKRALVELVGHFASRIDAWVIAEGIETEEDLREVVRMGAPLGQGFLLNRPAPAFAPCPPPVRELLARVRQEAPDGASLLPLVEPVRTVPSEAATGATAADDDLLVVVDAWGRPLEVRHRGQAAEAMRATTQCQLPDVLRRAMVRPPEERFAPVVVIDDRGQPIGAVPIERMVEALAKAVHPAD